MRDSFQSEIELICRRIESMTKRIEILTKYEYLLRKKSELLFEEIKELEGILRPIWWLRSWAFDRLSVIISKGVEHCERKLVRYKFRLTGLVSIEEVTGTIWPPDVG